MARVCHKLAWINEVYMLNSGQIYVKYPSTANNFISPNTAAWKTQTSHTVGFEITATPQIEILFTASKKHQHRNTANPHVPLRSV